MKHFFYSLPPRLRQGLAVVFLGLIFSVAFHLADHSRAGSSNGLLRLGESEAEGEEDGDRVYPQGKRIKTAGLVLLLLRV